MDSRNFAIGFHFGYNGMAYIPMHRLFQMPQIPVLQRALMFQHALLNGSKPFIPTPAYNAMTPDVRNPFLWPYIPTQISRASIPSQHRSSRESSPSQDQSEQSSSRASTPPVDPSRQSPSRESSPSLALFQPWKSEASDQSDDEDEDRLIIDLSRPASPNNSQSSDDSPQRSLMPETPTKRRLVYEASSQSGRLLEASSQRRNLTEASTPDIHVSLTPPLVGTPPLSAQRDVLERLHPGESDSEDEHPQPPEKKQRTRDTPKPRDPTKKPDERKYTCRYCDKSFTRTNTRRSHEMRHTGAMPYGCDTCGRRFRQKSNLDRHHLTVHTDLKPFSCRVCHRDFNRACNLRKHLEKHVLKLEEGRGVCLVCGREFARLAEAVNHIAEEQCVPTPEQRA